MDECICGLTYDRFRTGLTFGEVRRMMWVTSQDSTLWRYKTRRMVLGYWRQIKKAAWASHCAECQHYERTDPQAYAAWVEEQCTV